jgi:SAM-dependent methyltransferase
LDVGCGTGALTQAILTMQSPEQVVGVDPSPGFIAHARQQFQDERVEFAAANAANLPFPDKTFDIVVSGLALNFMPESALAEMRQVTADHGRIAAYVWDYAGKMEWLRYFWDAAVAVDPAASAFDEGQRFPICDEDNLINVFAEHELHLIQTAAIDIPTHFASFDAYWEPFLCRRFPAPQYVASLSDDHRDSLRAELYRHLPINRDGSVDLIARAWAVSGSVV